MTENILIKMFNNDSSKFKEYCTAPSYDKKLLILMNKQKGKGISAFTRDSGFDSMLRKYSEDVGEKFNKAVLDNFMSYSKSPDKSDVDICDKQFKDDYKTLAKELEPIFNGGCSVYDVGKLLDQYKPQKRFSNATQD